MKLAQIAILSAAIAAFGGVIWAAQEQEQQSLPSRPSARRADLDHANAPDEVSPGMDLMGSRLAAVPPQEQVAFQKAVNQLDTDRMIVLGEKFVQNYPESQLRGFIYSALANAYREKNDYDKVVENGEKSIALNPDNIMSLAIVAHTLPKKLQGSGLEAAQKLSRAERYARHGLKKVDLQLQPDDVLPEELEQFEKRKANLKSMFHSALGLVYLQRGIMS